MDFSETKKSPKPCVPSFNTKNLKALDEKFIVKNKTKINHPWVTITRKREEDVFNLDDRPLTNKIKETREIKPFSEMNTPKGSGKTVESFSDVFRSPKSKENNGFIEFCKPLPAMKNFTSAAEASIQGVYEEEILKIKFQNIEMINDETFFERMRNVFEGTLTDDFDGNYDNLWKKSIDSKDKPDETKEAGLKKSELDSKFIDISQEVKKKPKKGLFFLKRKIKDVDVSITGLNKFSKK